MGKKTSLYILGAGGMARELFAMLRAMGKISLLKGFIVQGMQGKKELYGLPVYGEEVLREIPKTAELIGGIGSPKKHLWIEKLTSDGWVFTSLIDPLYRKDPSVVVGVGSVVCSGVITTCDSTIGSHTILNVGATVNHDAFIGDFCHIAPGVHIAGNVHIGNNTWIGIGSSVIQGVSIGSDCFIGAGSVVIEDIPDGYLSYGVPAKLVRRIEKKDWETLLK